MSVDLATRGRRAMADLDPAWWSATVLDASGATVFAHRADEVRSVASVGKLLLLSTLDAQLDDDADRYPYRLTKTGIDTVADSGVWQHMTIDALSVHDLAVLIASVSDNLATNVLLRHLGLDAVTRRTADLGLVSTALHDRVRDERRSDHPVQLASGTAAELASFLDRGTERLLGWMSSNTDHSLVGALLGLDPLVIDGGPGPLRLANKTGTDDGVRCDVGRLSGPAGAVSYAILVNWETTSAEVGAIQRAVQSFGLGLAEVVLDR